MSEFIALCLLLYGLGNDCTFILHRKVKTVIQLLWFSGFSRESNLRTLREGVLYEPEVTITVTLTHKTND